MFCRARSRCAVSQCLTIMATHMPDTTGSERAAPDRAPMSDTAPASPGDGQASLGADRVSPGAGQHATLPPGIDRRGFLRTAAGGTAAIALASMIPAGCAADYPQAEEDGVELEALSPKEYAVAVAAAEALLVDVPVEPSTVVRRMDHDLARVD